ncbi:hypothetical protein DM01DRAFT_1411215 [Hesseltinella vesiculosa]|uniref:Uncharacterized protein n=1 Tax=Hesseltinella vesiculosa TaxID=101127 RepID=A0A1X2G4G3_9FUNG|nr:hypothetical protein DM01DRAFT_1411215 [Hesseltinella vesiculosa]
MGDWTPLFSFFALIPIVISGFILYAHQRTYGTLTDITTESVAYQRNTYGKLLDWDQYSLQIHGRPSLILGGEFHYWRYPDRTRWQHILEQYRSLGFNTIRIYFHWGYHSPDEGIYLFDDNRDVDYLLNLCEEMGIFVLAAPGPYICAETQGGGYPAWIAAKRELRVRHNKFMLWRTYDPDFAHYEIQWLNQILPILGRHQITENTDQRRGCVLGLQLDNELFETMSNILPIGLRDQMRILCKAARDAGITVPLFTNDGFEEGGWVPGKPANFWSKHPFGIDLYGFDKYVVFAPASSPKSWLIDQGNNSNNWHEWDPKTVENSMDKLEKTVRGFGGGAKHSPILIPELQGGWFNHYQLQHTYDEIFEFYGADYTRILVETSLAQGVTAVSLYIGYGGTNWGALGDPDVYTSYDYSACIREYGYMSSRGRLLRQTLLFVQSFETYFSRTDLLATPTIKPAAANIINRQRVSVGTEQPVVFTFFRNFDRKKRDVFDLEVMHDDQSFAMAIQMAFKTSFIALGNYKVSNGLHLIQSTLPILARMAQPESNEEIWFIEPNTIGALAFVDRSMELTGNMHHPTMTRQDGVALLHFDKPEGWTKITTTDGHLFLVGLTKEAAMTIHADFEAPYWTGEGDKPQRYPGLVAWGADTLFYNKIKGSLSVEYNVHDQQVHVVTWSKPQDSRLAHDDKDATASGTGVPYHRVLTLPDHRHEPLTISRALTAWESSTVQWDDLPWQPLRTNSKGDLVWESLDYHFTSGHALYRNDFTTPPSQQPRVQLTLNMRHRATVLMNGRIVGGHTTYSRQLFMPGAKVGPDPSFMGSRTYDLSPFLSHEGTLNNTLIVLVDSFGLNRDGFVMDDIRNPRGIIKAKLHGISLSTHASQHWQVTGVDVRKLHEPYNSAGFPDEQEKLAMTSFQPQTHTSTTTLPLDPAQGVQWWQATFDHPVPSDQRIPLRLHLDGEWTGQVFVNGKFAARFYGNGDCPQHDYYLPDDWLQSTGNTLRILAYTWTPTEAHVSLVGWRTNFPGNGNVIHASNTSVPAIDYMVWKDQITIQ